MTVSALVCMTLTVSIIIIAHSVSSAPLIGDPDVEHTTHKVVESNGTHKLSLLDQDGLFEGDIKISEDLIRKYYNLSSTPGGEKDTDKVMLGDEHDSFEDELDEDKHSLEKRGAVANDSMLWTNAEFHINFHQLFQLILDFEYAVPWTTGKIIPA